MTIKEVLAKFVQKCLDEGSYHRERILFTIAPAIEHFYDSRFFCLVIKGVLTYWLWAVNSVKETHYLRRLCPWRIEDLEYKGLCSQ